MADFNPVAEGKRAQTKIRLGAEWYTDDEVMALTDYNEALVTALRDTQPYVDKIADEWDDPTADVLAHTIRHLLDD